MHKSLLVDVRKLKKIEQVGIFWPEVIGYTLTQNRMAWLHWPWGGYSRLDWGYSSRRHGTVGQGRHTATGHSRAVRLLQL